MRQGPTELLLVRHGESVSSRTGTVGGPMGCGGLTETGREQVRRLARRLREDHARRPVDALYTSPLRRARESARIVSAALGLPAVTEPGLREADCGTGDGRPWREVVDAFGGTPVLSPDRPLAPDGESWGAYLARVRTAVDRLLERHAGQRVLVVAHGETITAVNQLLLDLPAGVRAHTSFTSGPACLTHWARRPLPWPPPGDRLGWTLLCHNDVSHLN
ncbi:histidine phosphatase family protein [Streptomyces sp. NPDC050610]|uniref:histidine phosphatase family protein n=1 Tax=Streptomyces sp. NPDC050610 TaxID=3157097 RepID=UPI003421DD2D